MDIDKFKTIAIIGDIDSCKTNLAIYLLREYSGTKTIYLFGYPKQIDDFKSITTFSDLFKIQNSIIFIDELQRFIKVYDKRSNYDFMELMGFLAHQGNCIIFTTQLSQFITRGVEAFIECWCITRLNDLSCLKNGSKPKRIVRNTNSIKRTKWSLALDKGEYLLFSELNEVGENGIHSFPNQNITKDWKV